MVTFGTLDTDAEAVHKSFACALELARAHISNEPIFIALNTGDVTSGELGETRSRTFSVVGDVVNTARRVLDIARERRLAVLVTDDAIRELGEEAHAADLTSLPAITLRGRTNPIDLWSVRP